MKLSSNIKTRISLIKTALTRRYIYSDLIKIAADHGIPFEGVCADVHPLEFARRICHNHLSAPDWTALEADENNFTPHGFPKGFNSEPSVSRFIGELAFCQPAKSVIEIGCFVGWTTAHIAQGLSLGSGGMVYAVDPSPECLNATMDNIKRHGFQKFVKLVNGLSNAATTLAALPAQADIVFIDASHDYPQTLLEIQLYAPRLSPKGVMVLHDSINAPGVRKSLLEITGFRKMTFGTERGNGVTLLFGE